MIKKDYKTKFSKFNEITRHYRKLEKNICEKGKIDIKDVEFAVSF